MVPPRRVNNEHIGSNLERLDRGGQHRSISQGEHPRLVCCAGFARHHHLRDEPLPRHHHRPHEGSVTGAAGSCLPSREGDEASTNCGRRTVRPRRRGHHAQSSLLSEHRQRISRQPTAVLARIGGPGGAAHSDDGTRRLLRREAAWAEVGATGAACVGAPPRQHLRPNASGAHRRGPQVATPPAHPRRLLDLGLRWANQSDRVAYLGR